MSGVFFPMTSLAKQLRSPTMRLFYRLVIRKKNVWATFTGQGSATCRGRWKFTTMIMSTFPRAVIPHGICDMQRNEGFITIGNSHETAAFVAENFLW
ncbi:MAG: hypothetical protein EPO28_01105 [Saprospiraceae bacterium]|nr:MAG: hypothetical protein EPO28_01105 [Saprospiraceae bacterium]